MALEPYASCPCGSGKKFKWCCQPIYLDIDKAFRQEADGQHEAALRTMDDIVAAHPANPEAWGRKAELLYRNGKVEEAEAAVQKAFDINPQYPFGFLLRGLFRQEEGEIAGALLLFRKAADAYDPEALDQLAHVYAVIGECELKLNRPVATRAALAIALHMQPANEDLRQAMDGYFGDKAGLPLSARREYRFRAPAGSLPADRRAGWDQALAGAATGKLTDAARAFWEQTEQDRDNAAAWYNLALARAWLGDNAGALEALDRYVNLETDEERGAEAWALGEVLRLGHGMEAHADVIEHAVFGQIRDPRPVSACLQEWQNHKRLAVLQTREDQPVMSALILEKVTALTADPATAPPPHVGAYILIVADRIRLWHTSKELFERTLQELQQKAGPALTFGPVERHPANFNEVLAEALVIPAANDKEQAERIIRPVLERHFEEVWIHRPLKALNGVPPVDAAGHAGLRKKLRGVVEFLAECAAISQQPYDFDRLRRKLGLLAAAPADGPARDIAALGAAELAAVSTDELGEEELDQAYQAALKLDAKELAGKFALALVSRPAPGKRPDRYPWYTHLVQLALKEGKSDAALDFINQGEQVDSAHNEGRRRNDYELRRAQVHAKRGEIDAAEGVFERLIAGTPAELRYRGSAAEAMLSMRQGSKALKFAEEGLAEARKQNNRDLEQYFLELAGAARKQGS
jgi:tetratricopeptide (TPR) repeat protein